LHSIDLTQRRHSEFYAPAKQKGLAAKTEFWDVVIMASPPDTQALGRDEAIAAIRQNPGLLTDEQWRNLPVFAQEKVAYDDNVRMKQLLGIAPKVVGLMDLPKLQSYAEREGRQEQQASTHQHLAVLLTANILSNTDFFRKLSFDLDQLSTVFKDRRQIKEKWKAAVLAGMNCAEPERNAHEDLVPSAVFTWGKDEDIIPIGRKFESLTKITRSRSKKEAEKNYSDFQRYQTSIEQKWSRQEYQDLNIIRKALQTAQERYIQSLQNSDKEKQAEYARDIRSLTDILSEQAENIVRYENENLKAATEDDELFCEANKESAESFRDNVVKIKFDQGKYQAIADQRKNFQEAASNLADCYDAIAGIQQGAKEKAKYRLAAKVARNRLNTGNLQSQESGITLADALQRRNADDSYGCLSSYCVKSKDTFTMQHAFDGSPIDALGDPKKEMDLFISDAESIHDIFILLQKDDIQCTMYCDYLIARHFNDSNSEFVQAIKDVLNQRAEQQLKQAVKTAYATCCVATEDVHEEKSVQLVQFISEQHFSNLGCDLQQSHEQLLAKLRKIKEAVSFIKAMEQPEACDQPHDEIDNAVKEFFQPKTI